MRPMDVNCFPFLKSPNTRPNTNLCSLQTHQLSPAQTASLCPISLQPLSTHVISTSISPKYKIALIVTLGRERATTIMASVQRTRGGPPGRLLVLLLLGALLVAALADKVGPRVLLRRPGGDYAGPTHCVKGFFLKIYCSNSVAIYATSLSMQYFS